MTILYIILLAIVQGITEFLPVSSFGHLSILENFFGMDHNAGVLLEAMLHDRNSGGCIYDISEGYPADPL